MRRTYLTIILSALVSVLLCPGLSAQKLGVSVNAGDALCMGTLGAEVSWAVAQRWSLDAGARYNPWTFRSGGDDQSQLRQRTLSAGARFWPWYVYSGFWFGAKAQWQEYNRGGFGGRVPTEEGDAFGLGLEAGYCWMLTHRFNINFGLGGWGGWTRYTRYECPRCGRRTDAGGRPFVLPNEIIIGLQFVF